MEGGHEGVQVGVVHNAIVVKVGRTGGGGQIRGKEDVRLQAVDTAVADEDVSEFD